MFYKELYEIFKEAKTEVTKAKSGYWIGYYYGVKDVLKQYGIFEEFLKKYEEEMTTNEKK